MQKAVVLLEEARLYQPCHLTFDDEELVLTMGTTSPASQDSAESHDEVLCSFANICTNTDS